MRCVLALALLLSACAAERFQAVAMTSHGQFAGGSYPTLEACQRALAADLFLNTCVDRWKVRPPPSARRR